MSKYNYIIKPIKLDDILLYDKSKFNSNNHWIESKRPVDYDLVLSLSNTSKWINIFKPNNIQIKIKNEIWIKWLKQANEISRQTGIFTELYRDEIDNISIELDKLYPNLFSNIGYFVRINNVSLKYGQYKEGPYYSFKQILESIVSCISTHTPIYSDTTELTIYLLDWVVIKPKNEFRVFVFENKITAISQQNLYSKLFDEDKTNNNFELELKQKLDIIVNYFYSTMINKINWINSYTFDFAIINSQPYLIELNSFGKEYAAGSALFHWILDENVLYNRFETNDLIEFRYTV
jgi:hypothetical protein